MAASSSLRPSSDRSMARTTVHAVAPADRLRAAGPSVPGAEAGAPAGAAPEGGAAGDRVGDGVEGAGAGTQRTRGCGAPAKARAAACGRAIAGPSAISAPPVPGGVAFLDGHEGAVAGRGDLAVAQQVGVDGGAVLRDGLDLGLEADLLAGGRRAAQLDVEVGGDGALRRGPTPLVHEGGGGAPVAVAVEQGAQDATVHDAGERLVVRLRQELHDEAALRGERDAFPVALDLQALLVGGAAPEADGARGVAVLVGLGHAAP